MLILETLSRAFQRRLSEQYTYEFIDELILERMKSLCDSCPESPGLHTQLFSDYFCSVVWPAEF